MTPMHPEEGGPIDPEIESALAAVRRPAARPAFQEELRGKFLVAADVSVRISPSARGPVPLLDEGRGRRRWLLRVGGLLAAGFILAIGFTLLSSPAPRWRILDLAPGSVVKADGAVLPVDDPGILARALARAREIEVEQGDLVIQVADLSLFHLGPGTKVAFDGFLRHEPGAPLGVFARSGRLRAVTGPGFHGSTMQVSADVIDATVTGTAFAVDYEEQGTCVCCLHGVVQVSAKGIGPAPKEVPPERMCLVRRDGGEPVWGGAPAHHATPLQALEMRAREIWPADASR